METIDSDYLIVGSGIAGLMSAIYLAEESTRKILLITKKNIDDSNSSKAQGGIACVMEPGDTFESHIADTLDAGAGLCDEDAVRKIVEAGPERIADLEKFGVVFDKGDSKSGYDLGREGGHTQRRILHAGDITGREVEAVLIDYVKKLLEFSDMAVIDICFESGFNDYANFIRTFKRIEGCSPGSFEIQKCSSEEK